MNLIDLKRLPKTKMLGTYENGKTKTIDSFKPFCYAEKGNNIRIGYNDGYVRKKSFWTNETVTCEKLRIDHPKKMEQVKKQAIRSNDAIFRFDLDYLLNYVLSQEKSTPADSLTGLVYDLEMDDDELLLGEAMKVVLEYDDGLHVDLGTPWTFEDGGQLASRLTSMDVVIGHNILWYDNEKMANFGADTTIQRMRSPITGQLEKAHLISNVLNIDTMQLCKRFISRPPSLKLETLAVHEEVGEPLWMSPAEINNADFEKLEKYCKNDTILTGRLAKKFLPQLYTVWETLQIPPTVYLRMYGTGTYEMSAILFDQLYGDEYYLPAKEFNVKYEQDYGNPMAGDYKKKTIVGPEVKTAVETGTEKELYENVYFADYSAMFPNIMLKYNVSAETVHEEENGEKVLLRDNDGNVSKVGIDIDDEKGFFVELQEIIMEKVDKYKQLAMDNPKMKPIYNTMKAMFRNNQCHGAMNSDKEWSHCRFINVLAGGKIYREARRLAKELEKEIREKGGIIINIDTDGIHFAMPDGDVDDLDLEKLDIDVDVETFDYGYFVAGKTYFLLDGDHAIVKGASLKGRNIPLKVSETFKEAVKNSMKSGEISRRRILSKMREEFLAKDIPEKELPRMTVRINIKEKSEYKSEHRKERTEFYKQKYGYEGGRSFDAVIVDGDKDLGVKPWATADKECWERVVPIEQYKGEELDRDWYMQMAERILDRFIPQFEQKTLD